MIKRTLCLVLLLALVLSVFAGCGKTEATPTEPPATVVTDPTTPEPSTEASTASEIDFALERSELTLVTPGETWTLYDGPVDLGQITWVSKDKSIATFDAGVVTAVASGTTEVSAEYNGRKVTCTVYCNLKNAPAATGEPEGNGITDAPANPNAGERGPSLLAPTNEVVPASFFDDAVFVGDSVSLKLSYYAGSTGLLGDAKFLVRGSYGVANALFDELLMPWQGQEMGIEEAIQATGAKKMFIMLGMNDIGLYGIDKTIEHWGKLLERIRSKCPDLVIYIESMSPVWTGGERGDLKNSNVDAYNVKLKAFAESNGCKFIDIAPYMKDSTGGLATPYCSDNYVHVTDAGVDTWIKVLKAYTGY